MRFRLAHLALLLPICAAVSQTATARDAVDVGFTEPTLFRSSWSFATQPAQSHAVIGDGVNAVRIPFAQLWPTHSLRLDGVALDERGRELIPAGSALIVLDGPTRVACEILRPSGHENYVCLIDPGADGTFDSYIKTFASFEYLFNSVMLLPGRARALAGGVVASELPEWAADDRIQMVAGSSIDDDDVFFAARARFSFCVERNGLSNIWGGAQTATNCLTAGETVDITTLPFARRVLGTVVALRSNGEGQVFLETRPLVETGTTSFN